MTNFYKRIFVLSFFLFFLFSCLIVKFYKIQIIDGKKWEKIALRQHKTTVVEPFMRGKIFANNFIKKEEKPLALDVLKFHLFIDPHQIILSEKKRLAENIFHFFKNISLEEKDKITAKFYKKNRAVKIFNWIDIEKKEKIEQWWNEYRKKRKIVKNAIFFVKDYKREHPSNYLLAQLLHTVRNQKDENFQAIPTGGVELYFNKYLNGKSGLKKIIRSPINSLETKMIKKAENGMDVYLTINQYIQAIVEEELKEGIKRVGAKGGWAVLMNPKNGHILACAQYPFFNLERYFDYFNNEELKEHSSLKPLSYAFEPGSIFKPLNILVFFMANRKLLSLNKEPIFSPIEKVDTRSGEFPGRKKLIKDGRKHNFLNMYLAIQKSSNVYMSKIMQRLMETLGRDWYVEALREYFGFGKKVNIEIFGENPGSVPGPKKFYKNKKPMWSSSTPYSLAMGHNILVNSIQIIRAYGIIANLGVDVKPTILKKIMKGKKVIFENKPKKKRIFYEEDVLKLIDAMKFITKRGGTSILADIPGYTEAGKSGTSEKIVNGRYSDQEYISSFVGLAPTKDPEIVLLVTVDTPKKKWIKGVGKSWHGGACAAPIFKKIGERVLSYLGVITDDPYGYLPQDPRSNRKKADWTNEVKNINKLYHYWNN